MSFTVSKFWFTDSTNFTATEKFTVSEARISGDFNNWGNGGGSVFSNVWAGSLVLNFRTDTNQFEVVQAFPSKSTIHFTVLVKAAGSETHTWQGYYDPFYLKSGGVYLFTPHTAFVDNGFKGYNAEYIVP